MIAAISLAGGIVTASAADLAHAAGATPEIQRGLVVGSAAWRPAFRTGAPSLRRI